MASRDRIGFDGIVQTVYRPVESFVHIKQGKPESVLPTVGTPLRRLREEKNWSLRRLAAESGVSVAAIQRIEIGAASGRLSTVMALTEALGAPLESLVDLVHARGHSRSWVQVMVPKRPLGEVDLTGDLRDPELRSTLVVVRAGARLLYAADAAGRRARCLYVLAGRLLIEFDDSSSETLAVGDAMHLMACDGMYLVNPSARSDVHVLCVADSGPRRRPGSRRGKP